MEPRQTQQQDGDPSTPGDPAYLLQTFDLAATVPPHRRELVIELLDYEDRTLSLAPGGPERVAAAADLKAKRTQLSSAEQRLLAHLRAEHESRRRVARRTAERRVPCPVCTAEAGTPCRNANGKTAHHNHLARRRAATAN